ncbi:MAG TPA: LPS export ABC transporter ATP-binding protein [Armatimonadota bacterium]|nr:LPS export ABC transporter ATP-binding protein [Armatimonadota bacterium]HOJ20663.1 LPS export ABC transporter ATP-binding protein [Armatimonadota bacterium]HOM80557.1 LPS export ABC transporter ATP-binding protein [Armatimonadota bacterium]HOQ29435.1 LPS export ABC transporter ATP-binding protein [Armatimonadota bacterium]HPO71398.1 LPS export ABC transporter ATP-binding protein [Armatimonadota bacterium]
MQITTDELVKTYRGRNVVDGVSLSVGKGEIVGLLGRNGAGKTTTFYMVVGLVRPRRGRVMLGDRDITRLPMYQRARAGIGYLAQEASVFRKLTVEQNLRLVMEMNRLSRAEQDKRIDQLLEEFTITHLRKEMGFSLSGGERRRVEIARCLATNPTFILLDEPFTGIDPIVVSDIQEIIRHLKNRGIGILITDHSVRETLAITDRAYIIVEGKIRTAGTPEQILNDPVAKEHYLGNHFAM